MQECEEDYLCSSVVADDGEMLAGGEQILERGRGNKTDKYPPPPSLCGPLCFHVVALDPIYSSLQSIFVVFESAYLPELSVACGSVFSYLHLFSKDVCNVAL